MGALTRWVLLGVLAGCAGRAPVRDKGMTPASSTRELLSQSLEPRRVALLIGVDTYDDPVFPDLKHAGADAEAVGELLRESEGGGFDEVRVLTGRELTDREAIGRALVALKDSVRREDSVVVYFSGHGTRLHDGEAWHRYLLVGDTRSTHIGDSALDLRDLQAFFASLPAVRRALIVDACFRGDGKSVVRPRDAEVPETEAPSLAPSSLFMGAGESHLFATSSGRPAREDDRLGHGVYTYYMLEALSWGFQEADLDRDGVVTTWEAHDFARGRTIEHTGGAQVPEATFRVIGEADLVLAGDPETRRAQEQAQIYLYGPKGTLTTATVVVDGRERGAFPGAVPVQPGRHHVVLKTDDRVLLEGYARLHGGRAYRADHLVRVLQGPKGMLGVRPMFVSMPSLQTSIGAGATGLEGWISRRANRGALRGAYVSWGLGGGLSGSRDVVDVGSVGDPREVAWSSLTLGYQADWRRLRVRGGLGATGLVVPPDDLRAADVLDTPRQVSEAGWWVAGAGPTLGGGVVVLGGLTATAEARVHGAWLDVDGDGTAAVVPMLAFGAGIELGY